MKKLVIIGAVVITILVGVYVYATTTSEPTKTVEVVTPQADSTAVSSRSVVTPGQYKVNIEKSTVKWSGQKPLISGYINDGSLALNAGDIVVTPESASGTFTIDMNTLSVSNTPTKPGSETKLEEHLKSERWFNVTEFPTAIFRIVSIAPQADSDTTFNYDVTGELTMKGVTKPLTFPATIFTDDTGAVVAEASLEFDRTAWGITAGSASFFDNLADNAINDMVALSFVLVAESN